MASQWKGQLSGSNSTDKSIQWIEPFSSEHSNNNQSSKRVGSRETFLVHPPCSNSSPTFNQHTQSFESFRKTRLVTKSGSLNVSARHVPQKTKRYFADLFTTLIDFRWPGVIFVFFASYVISWVLFALIWWSLVAIRGPSVCVSGVHDWTTAFLFSIETQQTIGYGTRAITVNCPEGTIIIQIQSLVGLILDAFMLGLTFTKLSQPRERMKTVMFSDYAVIAPRDGKLCLMFRVGDVRKSQIVDASIRMQLFRTWKTSEERHIPFYQEDLKVCYDWRNPENDFRNQLFLLLPMVIIHVIGENSPLYTLTPKELKESEYEVVVVLDGIVEHTGMNTQPKTSYTSDEILWGYDFHDVIDRNCVENGQYYVDFSKFNDLSKIELPSCSPKEFYARQTSIML